MSALQKMPLAMAANWYWCARQRLVGRDRRLDWAIASRAMAALSADPRPAIATRALETLQESAQPCDMES